MGNQFVLGALRLGVLTALTFSLSGCLDGWRSESSSTASTKGGASSSGGTAVSTERQVFQYDKPTAKPASRFLQQVTFGPTPQEVQTVVDMGFEAWIEDQFKKPQISLVERLRLATASGATDLREPLWNGLWSNMIRGDDELRERVAFALSQIFVVSGANDAMVAQSLTLASYYDMLGRNAFGNYRTLLEDVALHPAMGLYLSALANDREDPATGRLPDENFAREIMQLFSIGLVQLNQDGTSKKDGGGRTIPTYDQDTILNMAKVFTGWSWGGPDKSDSRFKYGQYPFGDQGVVPMQSYPKHHSTGQKRIVDGVVIPAGGTPESDLAATLDKLANHPNTGPFISYRLIQRMVTSNPSPAYVSRVVSWFNNNGAGVRGDLKAVIRAILLDPEARSATAASNPTFGRLREPVQRMTNLARATRAAAPDGGLLLSNYASVEYALGQNPLFAPSVFNWFRPDYVPPGMLADQGLVAPEFQIMNEYSSLSVTNSMYNFLYYGFQYRPDGVQANLARWVALADQPEALVDDLDMLFVGGAMSANTRLAIVAAVRGTPMSITNWQTERARTAIYLTLASPDYMIQK